MKRMSSGSAFIVAIVLVFSSISTFTAQAASFGAEYSYVSDKAFKRISSEERKARYSNPGRAQSSQPKVATVAKQPTVHKDFGRKETTHAAPVKKEQPKPVATEESKPLVSKTKKVLNKAEPRKVPVESKSVPTKTKPVDPPRKEEPKVLPKATVVLASDGVELYNLGTRRQANFFSVYFPKENKWLSYHLPRLADGRDSCPITCNPYLHDDGTIYIGGAGGVLNRLSPNEDGGRIVSYTHSYVVIDRNTIGSQALNFTANNQTADLIAVQDELVKDVLVAREAGGEADGENSGESTERSLFESYREASPDFHMFVEQGLLSEGDRSKLWNKQKRTVLDEKASLNEAAALLQTKAQELAGAADAEQQLSALFQEIIRKDGPTKEEAKKIWERNNEFFGADNVEGVLAAAEKLMVGLSEEWKDNLYTKPTEKKPKAKWKIYDERLPVYRVNVSEISDDPSQLIVSVMGHVFRMDHAGQFLSALGAIAMEGERRVDIRGLIALDQDTFLIGDMGEDEAFQGPKTLRVVSVNKDSGTLENHQAYTDALLAELSKDWQMEEGAQTTPRVKTLIASRECQKAGVGICATLYIRTKHSGNDRHGNGIDLLQAEMHIDNGVLTVAESRITSNADQKNQEYLAAAGDRLLVGLETEDYVRRFHIAHASEQQWLLKKTLRVDSYQTQNGVREYRENDGLPALPVWVPFTGWGYQGIYSR
ncbi:hypothetical protein [Parendozoicomonas haliclonae]|uniref:Uncharacterized protein n=1 Tax=Parendozoicomonas haliclonae TaxID=1960125 RepID=A0A1X7AJA4_9GAMM|nr:hypothetical protein [Parendozoicomonas haliclonae]SMA46321.1 hypothetical protein EHSB41UT_02142 [Parendozoicomonas haliclonae]